MAEKLKQDFPVVAEAGWLSEHCELILGGVVGLLLLDGWSGGSALGWNQRGSIDRWIHIPSAPRLAS